MKFPQLFTKIPKHRRFDYTPRHYDPQEDERKEREFRIRQELAREGRVSENSPAEESYNYRARIAGSFKSAKRTSTPQKDPTANMIRLIITLILTVGLVGYLQFGKTALIVVAFVFIPFYLYLKFRRSRQ